MCWAEDELDRLEAGLDRDRQKAQDVILRVLDAARDVERGIIDLSEFIELAQRENREVYANALA